MNTCLYALVAAELIQEEEAATLQADLSHNQLMLSLIQERGLCSQQIAKAYAHYYGEHFLPHIPLNQLPADIIDIADIRSTQFLPFKFDSDGLHVAIGSPDAFEAVDLLRFTHQTDIVIYFADYCELLQTNNTLTSQHHYQDQDLEVSTLIDQALTDAIHQNASDVHFEQYEKQCRIRIRVDGVLKCIATPSRNISNKLATQLKLRANCDIAEKRIPQDGRMHFTTPKGLKRDCRVSTCPTLFGEKIVIRLLESNQKHFQVHELGMSKKEQTVFLNTINQPQGLILVTGPTGSGKTITLYTALEQLNTSHRNICTIEDPVEIKLSGINQVNVDKKAKLGFNNSLRSFLRQDPDVIMIGEIRDEETAKIAIKAAQTGHLVLASLHTNGSRETLLRLKHLGIKDHDLIGSLRLIIAQRLVRKKHQDGYKGRTGIYELLPVDNHLLTHLNQIMPDKHFSQYLNEKSLHTLAESAAIKISEKITDQAEVQRVLS